MDVSFKQNHNTGPRSLHWLHQMLMLRAGRDAQTNSNSELVGLLGLPPNGSPNH